MLFGPGLPDALQVASVQPSLESLDALGKLATPRKRLATQLGRVLPTSYSIPGPSCFGCPG